MRSKPFRNNLKALLAQKDLTYEAFAVKSKGKFTVNAVKNWANQRNQPSIKNIDIICSLLGCQKNELLYISS